MPTLTGTLDDLGKAIKKSHPGKYDKYSDMEVARAIQDRYPGKYDNFKGRGDTLPGGIVAPPAGGRPDVPGLTKDTPDNFFTSPNGLLRSGGRKLLDAAGAVAAGHNAEAVSDAVKGVSSVGAPVAIGATLPALAAAPVATLVGLGASAAGGYGGGAAARAIAEKAGGTPEQQQAAEDVGQLGGSVLGGAGVSKLADIPGKVITQSGRVIDNAADAILGPRTAPGDVEFPLAPKPLTPQEQNLRDVSTAKAKIVPSGGDARYQAAQANALPQLKAQEAKVGPITVDNKDIAYEQAGKALNSQLDAYHQSAVARDATADGNVVAKSIIESTPQDAVIKAQQGDAESQKIVDDYQKRADFWFGKQVPVESARSIGRANAKELEGYHEADPDQKLIIRSTKPNTNMILAEKHGIDDAYGAAVDPARTDANGNQISEPGENIKELRQRYADLITSRQYEGEPLDKKILKVPDPSTAGRVWDIGRGLGLTGGGASALAHGNAEGVIPLSWGARALQRGIRSSNPVADAYADAHAKFTGDALDPVAPPPAYITPRRIPLGDEGFELSPDATSQGPQGGFSVARQLGMDQPGYSQSRYNPFGVEDFSVKPKLELTSPPSPAPPHGIQEPFNFAKEGLAQGKEPNPEYQSGIEPRGAQLHLMEPGTSPEFDWEHFIAPEAFEKPTP